MKRPLRLISLLIIAIFSVAAGCSSSTTLNEERIGSSDDEAPLPTPDDDQVDLTCARTWLAAYRECATRLTPELGSQEWVDINYNCYGVVAKDAFDACCAGHFDDSCAMRGMDWTLPEAGGEDCSPTLFETDAQCRAAAGLLESGGDYTDDQVEILAYCWQAIAGGANDRCCSRHPERCDTDDLDADGCFTFGWWTEGENCATVLFATQNRCLAEAGTSLCDARAPAEETIARCWQAGVDAKAACCAATPDWSCPAAP